MFKAITKGKAPPADSKGTLTALWGKRQQKEEAGTPAPAPPAASDPQDDAAAEGTPAGAAKAGAPAAAAPTTGGDVAIGAAPEPSPEPALAAAQAAAAAEAAAAEQQQQDQAAEPAAAARTGGKVGWRPEAPCSWAQGFNCWRAALQALPLLRLLAVMVGGLIGLAIFRSTSHAGQRRRWREEAQALGGGRAVQRGAAGEAAGADCVVLRSSTLLAVQGLHVSQAG